MTEFQLNGNVSNPAEVLGALNELDSDLGKVVQHIETLHETDDLAVQITVNKTALDTDSTNDVLTVTVRDA